MEQKPFISIITICFNNASGLAETIDSIRKIKTSDIEYIVIDGASTDNTHEILERNSDIIDIPVSEKDSGIYNAINKGINLANGTLIGLIHSGDFYLENAFSSLRELHKAHPEAVLYGALKAIKNGIFDSIWGINACYLPEKMIPHPACFVPKLIYEKFGTYDESFKIAADYECFLRFYKAGVQFIFTDTIICGFNLEGISQKRTEQTEKEVESIKKRYGTYKVPTLKSKIKAFLKIFFR
ncbi:MAG: glycosyltransferase [Treponema sp.]|jgi:glycosyltransferase involved in cell wall biosynthesis|nr:glycosyltransferase [Treponema sp.]